MKFCLNGNTAIFNINDNLDYNYVPQIKKNIDRIIKKNKNIKSIAFDLEEVNYMDTAGLAFLIFFSKKFREDFSAINLKEELKYIFSLDEYGKELIMKIKNKNGKTRD